MIEALADLSLLELFRTEAESQTQVLTAGLLTLERDSGASDQLEACMRAAHSLKGAASIVGLTVGVRVAHAMEDCFVAAQQGRIALGRAQIDRLLGSTDLLMRIANTPEADIGRWADAQKSEVDGCLSALARIVENDSAIDAARPDSLTTELTKVADGTDCTDGIENSCLPVCPSLDKLRTTLSSAEGSVSSAVMPEATPAPPVPRRRATDQAGDASDRVLRVTAENLNRLLGLAGESLVESRWVKPFADSLLRLKRLQRQSSKTLDRLRDTLSAQGLNEQAQTALADAQRVSLECQQVLAERLHELEMFDRRSINLSNRLYDEALSCRMRPFADGVQAFPRMVREVARSLGKQVKLEIIGEMTQVDRDILGKLDAPLGHLLRNAVDHGLESPEEREAAGKPAEGLLRLEARHSAGALHISISDDGGGVDLDKLRRAVVARNLLNPQAAAVLSDAELLEFLFLPGFSMKATVTDISGRGVGLDAVQDMVKQVRGTVRVSSQLGIGTRFQLQLPVTLSVVRTLLAEIGGEPYAFPLAHIIRTLQLPKDRIEVLEGREHFDFDGRRVGLITAHQILEIGEGTRAGDQLPVIVMGDSGHTYGLVVDRFLGERELVVQPLDAHLGKIKDIAAGALMPDGSPVLIVDAEDMVRSIDKLVSGGRLSSVSSDQAAGNSPKRKRVLVVDDSLTVREVERKLLGNRGYDVEVAVDGMDGWNVVRTGHFDLVVTDVDMPRMDGIELVELINKDPNLKSLPVMIVSYKDRDEDRQRGLEAGAAYYLTKGSFHDETLLQAVVDLIGEAAA
jgi:two-component system sensor histidine kinase and response regulator WspE